MRRSLFFIVAFAFVFAQVVFAEQPRTTALPPALDRTINSGLTWLQKQQKDDGSFGSDLKPSLTGLSLLAFLASGHTPEVGHYGVTVRTAADYLANLNPEGGYFGRDESRMYGHCIVTLALAEACGTEVDEIQRRRIRSTLEKALKVIYAGQDMRKEKPQFEGGWRYQPQSSDSDLSVSAWAMVAMRACESAGLQVPKARVDRAAAYLRRCYRPEQRGFSYQGEGEANAAMTGAALLNLYLLDAVDQELGAAASKFLIDKPVRDTTQHYYYALYYTTQAAFQAGDPAWAAVWKNNSEQLLAAAQKDGSWPAKPDVPGNDQKNARIYATAMSVLTLSVPLRVLPIYQR
jgi:hypothetical protein